MNRNAIARIIIYSILLLILIAILVSGIAFPLYSFKVNSSEDGSTCSNAMFSPENLHSLDISWASGSIEIYPEDVYNIQVSESFSGNAPEMIITVQGDTLCIAYSKKSWTGIHSPAAKNLTVLVPQNWYCSQLTVNSAATELSVSDMQLQTVSLNTASGDCRFRNCNADSLELDAASGELQYEGTLNALEVNGASTEVCMNLQNCPREITASTLSGNVDLTLPADCGFIVNRDSLGGSFHCDFDTIQSGNTYIHGDGSCKIDCSGLSSSLTLKHHAEADHHGEAGHHSG